MLLLLLLLLLYLLLLLLLFMLFVFLFIYLGNIAVNRIFVPLAASRPPYDLNLAPKVYHCRHYGRRIVVPVLQSVHTSTVIRITTAIIITVTIITTPISIIIISTYRMVNTMDIVLIVRPIYWRPMAAWIYMIMVAVLGLELSVEL